MPGATALVQAKASGAFTDTHQRYWDAARRARGDTLRPDGIAEQSAYCRLVSARLKPSYLVAVRADKDQRVAVEASQCGGGQPRAYGAVVAAD